MHRFEPRTIPFLEGVRAHDGASGPVCQVCGNLKDAHTSAIRRRFRDRFRKKAA